MPVPTSLASDLQSAGYYPELTGSLISELLFEEEVIEHFVHMETHVDLDSIHRHVTVFVLTPTRLLLTHVDDDEHDVPGAPSRGMTSVEDIPLSAFRTVLLGRSYVEPASYTPGKEPFEVSLTMAWGAVNRVEVFPETCGDPQCQADHGYGGSQISEDVALRVSSQAEGPEAVAQALKFALKLKELVHRARLAR